MEKSNAEHERGFYNICKTKSVPLDQGNYQIPPSEARQGSELEQSPSFAPPSISESIHQCALDILTLSAVRPVDDIVGRCAISCAPG